MPKRRLGADPEFFLVKGNSTKATSVHLLDTFQEHGYNRGDDYGSYKYASLKSDGWAVEMNTYNGGVSCRDYLIPAMAGTFKSFYQKHDGWSLSAVPVMELTKTSVRGKTPMGVTEFGCLPDRDAYELTEKTPFRSDYHDRFRYAGGHMHLSVYDAFERQLAADDPEVFHAAWAILLDVYFSIPLVAMLGNVNDYGEAKRRAYYGQAGSYRIKDYGIEYRVPSSAVWLSPVLVYWAYGQARKVSIRRHILTTTDSKVLEKAMTAFLNSHNPHRIQHIINNHDVEEADRFVSEFGLKDKLYMRNFYEVMRQADEKGIPLLTDFKTAWNLDGPIINHGYQGVEAFMNPGRYNDQFKVSMPKHRALIARPKAWTAVSTARCGNPNCVMC